MTVHCHRIEDHHGQLLGEAGQDQHPGSQKFLQNSQVLRYPVIRARPRKLNWSIGRSIRPRIAPSPTIASSKSDPRSAVCTLRPLHNKHMSNPVRTRAVVRPIKSLAHDRAVTLDTSPAHAPSNVRAGHVVVRVGGLAASMMTASRVRSDSSMAAMSAILLSKGRRTSAANPNSLINIIKLFLSYMHL